MRNYQILSVIGGVLSIIIVFSVYITLGVLESFSNAFGGDSTFAEDLVAQITLSIFLYIGVIIIPFVVKNTKLLGYMLIILAISTVILVSAYGILGFALLIAGGIAAIRYKSKTVPSSSLDILKERYAKGEISLEEFEKMKSDLES